MIIGGEITDFSANDNISLKEHTYPLAKIIRNPTQPDCYFQICNSCPFNFKSEGICQLIDSNMIETVQSSNGFLQINQYWNYVLLIQLINLSSLFEKS